MFIIIDNSIKFKPKSGMYFDQQGKLQNIRQIYNKYIVIDKSIQKNGILIFKNLFRKFIISRLKSSKE